MHIYYIHKTRTKKSKFFKIMDIGIITFDHILICKVLNHDFSISQFPHFLIKKFIKQYYYYYCYYNCVVEHFNRKY